MQTDDPTSREDDPRDTPTDPSSTRVNAWILNSVNQLAHQLRAAEARLSQKIESVDEKTTDVERRLRSVEKKIWWAIGAAVAAGAVLALLSQILSFDFEISVRPK